jgi:hypothetical protein
MKRLNKSYLSGIIVAVLCVSLFSGNQFIASLTASNGIGQIPRELRLGIELGLLSGREAKSSSFLRRNISNDDFATKLTSIMSMLGHPNASKSYLYENRILNAHRANASLSRKDSVEILSRLLIDFSLHFPLQQSPIAAKDYNDYKIPGKFANQISYLQNRFIITSYSEKLLGTNRSLSQREAISFIYRLYEAVSMDKIISSGSAFIAFIDLHEGHPVLEIVQNLASHGAFDSIILPPSFDGEGYVNVRTVKSMITAILERKGFTYKDNRINDLLSSENLDRFTTRSELALLLEYFLDTVSRNNLTAEIAFKDVKENQREYIALIKAEGHGIKLGYSNMFKGHENVSLTEVVMTLHKAVNSNFKLKKTRSYEMYTEHVSVIEGDLHQPATREDFQNLIKLLEAKRDKIRKIIGPGQRPSSKDYFQRELR